MRRRDLVTFVALAVVATGCITYDPGVVPIAQPATAEAVEVAHGSFYLGVPNETAVMRVALPADAEAVRISLDYSGAGSRGFHVDGLGGCDWTLRGLFTGADGVTLDCGGVPAGDHTVVFHVDEGQMRVAARVVAVLPRTAS